MNLEQLILPAGQVLSVVADGNSIGHVSRLGVRPGEQSQSVTQIAAGAGVAFGPYDQAERFEINSTSGSLTASMAYPDLNPAAPVSIAAGVSVSLTQVGPLRSYVVTFSGCPVATVDADTDGYAGSVALFSLPIGIYRVLPANLSLVATVSGGLGATADVLIGVGTVAGTASSETFASASSYNLLGIADAACSGSTGAAEFGEDTDSLLDAHAAAKTVYLSVAGADADSDDDGAVTVSGTLYLTLVYLGTHGDVPE